MYNIMIFLHVISALLLGAYVVFPFLVGRASVLSGSAQESFVGLLRSFNRVGQFSLIIVFLTGGAMISQVNPRPSVAWMVVSIVLLLIIGALAGMIGARSKKLIAAVKSGASTASDLGKMKAYSWIAAIAVIVAVLFMTNPQILS